MTSRGFSRRQRETLFSAVSVGFFLLLIGLLFVIRPGLVEDTITFFSNFNVTQPVPNTQVFLPAPDPVHVATNSTVREANVSVYSAVQQFSIAWGIFLIALLALRFAYGSPRRKKAENVSDIVFSYGVAYFLQTWLIEPTRNNTYQAQTWFEFWALILVVLGVSLIVRAAYLAASRISYA